MFSPGKWGSDSNGEKNNELGPEPLEFPGAAFQNPSPAVRFEETHSRVVIENQYPAELGDRGVSSGGFLKTVVPDSGASNPEEPAVPIGFLTEAERERLDRFPSQVLAGDLATYFTSPAPTAPNPSDDLGPQPTGVRLAARGAPLPGIQPGRPEHCSRGGRRVRGGATRRRPQRVGAVRPTGPDADGAPAGRISSVPSASVRPRPGTWPSSKAGSWTALGGV